jgi:hypothetical protein
VCEVPVKVCMCGNRCRLSPICVCKHVHVCTFQVAPDKYGGAYMATEPDKAAASSGLKVAHEKFVFLFINLYVYIV